MVMRMTLAAILCGAAALPALAECPVRIADVAAITVTRDDPFLQSTYRATPSGSLTEERKTDRDGIIEELRATYLHPLAPQDRVSSKNTVRVDYAGNPSDLSKLDEIGEWVSPVTVSVGGEIVANGQAIKRFMEKGNVKIGFCRYAVWQVEDRLQLDGSAEDIFWQYYAPDLGLVIGSIRVDANGNEISGVFFDRIEADPN